MCAIISDYSFMDYCSWHVLVMQEEYSVSLNDLFILVPTSTNFEYIEKNWISLTSIDVSECGKRRFVVFVSPVVSIIFNFFVLFCFPKRRDFYSENFVQSLRFFPSSTHSPSSCCCCRLFVMFFLLLFVFSIKCVDIFGSSVKY